MYQQEAGCEDYVSVLNHMLQSVALLQYLFALGLSLRPNI